MKQLTSWFKTAITTVLDPDREARIESLYRTIHNGIASQQKGFTLDRTLRLADHSEKDVQEAAERVYKHTLERAWADGAFSDGEKRTASWLAEVLRIQPELVGQLNHQQAR